MAAPSREIKVQKAQFSFLNPEQIRALSVCQITRQTPGGILDGGDETLEGTPYDKRMGPLENGEVCPTCGFDPFRCCGHFGHIELPVPIPNVIYATRIVKLLNVVCPKCSSTRIHHDTLLRQHGVGGGFKKLRAIAKKCEKVSECWNCSAALPRFAWDKTLNDFYYFFLTTTRGKKTVTEKKIFTGGNIHTIFSKINNDVACILGFNTSLLEGNVYTAAEYTQHNSISHVHETHPASLIFTVLPVIPPCNRPYVVRDSQICDDDITDKYNSIIKTVKKILADDAIKNGETPLTNRKGGGKLTPAEREQAEKALSEHISTLINNKDGRSKLSSGGRPHNCLSTRLNGKDGHIQTNIAGKRVDFSARSVIIGGGIDIRDDELGIPRIIAQELTKPELVREWNFERCNYLLSEGRVNRVLRGGNVFRVSYARNFVLQLGDIIERQLQDGDIVLFNRQPSLRVESFLAFRAKLIDGYAFRLALCWTKSYNADFDGDEMNLHVPQSISATAEALILMKAEVHIVSGQKNAPVNGLCQDALSGSYILSNTWEEGQPDTFMSVELFLSAVEGAGISMGVVYDTLLRAKKYYPDYISISKKKRPEFTSEVIPGKLALSVLFPKDMCYKRKTETSSVYPEVEIRDGVLLPTSGPLCAKVIGPKAQSIIHELWKGHSPKRALEFFSNAQQLIDRWYYRYGLSLGISDCIGDSKDELNRILKEMDEKCAVILARAPPRAHLPPHIEAEISAVLNGAFNTAMTVARKGLAKGQRNSFNILRDSGAKGSPVNTTQITAFVGPQSFNGARMPMELNGGTRTLPIYDIYENTPRSRGFVYRSYVDGLSPDEVWHHAKSGRVGVVATAVGTATTGYAQKRIARKVENCVTEFDGSVRDANGCIIQFLYNGMGMDPRKLCYTPGVECPFYANISTLAEKLNSRVRYEALLQGLKKPEDTLRELTEEEKTLLVEYLKYSNIETEVTLLATTNFRELTKKALAGVKIYETRLIDFCVMVRDAFDDSKSQRGDAVGLNCSSNIGEPTTQMNMNTFHHTGNKEKDVSAGIPRLDEVLNVTKSEKQKKPSVTVTIREGGGSNHSSRNAFYLSEEERRMKISMCTISEIVEDRGYTFTIESLCKVTDFVDEQRWSGDSSLYGGDDSPFVLDLVAENPKGEKLCVMWLKEKKITSNISHILERLDDEETKDGIVVITQPGGDVTPAGKSFIRGLVKNGYTIGVWKIEETMFNISRHFLQPKFEVCSPAEKKKIFEEYGITKDLCPQIKYSDPMVRYLGVKVGTLLRIRRKILDTNLQEIYYRVVVM